LLRHTLIQFSLARRAGRPFLDSLVFALSISKPPEQDRTDEEERARLVELKKRWDEG
jgi:hypothetical protein